MANITIAAPVRPSANSGNDVTAARWADQLTRTGHPTSVVPVVEGADGVDHHTQAALNNSDILIALHARRSAQVAEWWSTHRPGAPLVAALAGTDLYVDMPTNARTSETVERADALIVLQDHAIERLAGFDPAWSAKAHVVYQSVAGKLPDRTHPDGEFRVVVLAHLREVKDPLLTAQAAASLPPTSRLRVHHAGRALDDEWQSLAEKEERTNPRYTWHRELSAPSSLELLASAHVLACTSRSEGGANVVSEAIALGVPVIGTEIGGNVGLLGRDHPGWFPVGDADALTSLLHDLETQPDRLARLEARSLGRQAITDPAIERDALRQVVDAALAA